MSLLVAWYTFPHKLNFTYGHGLARMHTGMSHHMMNMQNNLQASDNVIPIQSFLPGYISITCLCSQLHIYR